MFKESDAEIWKDIDGLEGEYAISTKGRVRNIKTGRILGGAYDGSGYKQVTLKHKTYKIHRLVALAFLPNPDNLPQVNHKNEKKDDNNVGNLEWCSASYNTNYSSHKRSCKVKQLTKDGKLIRIWDSLSQIEHELGYKNGSISNVCKGMRRYVYGFKWQYVNPSSQRVKNRKVIAYKGSEQIGEFPSAKKASEALGLESRSIYYCLSGRLKSNKGFTFKYLE